MDNVPLGSDPDRRQQNELASLFGAPAYVRRAQAVHGALELLLAECHLRREEALHMPRVRLGTLHARAGSFAALTPGLIDPAEVAVLESLHDQLTPRLRLPPPRTASARLLGRALAQLVESLTRFNARWGAYVGKLDLRRVNELREGYNRYYVIEKARALRSDLLARQGFTPLPPLTADEVLRHLPLLPVPRLP